VHRPAYENIGALNIRRDMRIFHSRCLSVLVNALGAVVAISFGRFLGSEGTAIMTTSVNLVAMFESLATYSYIDRSLLL
jgi:hypothetical protein